MMIGLTSTPSTLEAELHAGWTLEQTSMEILSALDVEAELEITLDAPLETSMEPLVRPSTPVGEV